MAQYKTHIHLSMFANQLPNDICEQSVYCARDEQSNCRYFIVKIKIKIKTQFKH